MPTIYFNDADGRVHAIIPDGDPREAQGAPAGASESVYVDPETDPECWADFLADLRAWRMMDGVLTYRGAPRMPAPAGGDRDALTGWDQLVTWAKGSGPLTQAQAVAALRVIVRAMDRLTRFFPFLRDRPPA